MRWIFVRDKDPSAAIAALLGALGTPYPREKTRIDNAPELCGTALINILFFTPLILFNHWLSYSLCAVWIIANVCIYVGQRRKWPWAMKTVPSETNLYYFIITLIFIVLDLIDVFSHLTLVKYGLYSWVPIYFLGAWCGYQLFLYFYKLRRESNEMKKKFGLL